MHSPREVENFLASTVVHGNQGWHGRAGSIGIRPLRRHSRHVPNIMEHIITVSVNMLYDVIGVHLSLQSLDTAAHVT